MGENHPINLSELPIGTMLLDPTSNYPRHILNNTEIKHDVWIIADIKKATTSTGNSNGTVLLISLDPEIRQVYELIASNQPWDVPRKSFAINGTLETLYGIRTYINRQFYSSLSAIMRKHIIPTKSDNYNKELGSLIEINQYDNINIPTSWQITDINVEPESVLVSKRLNKLIKYGYTKANNPKWFNRPLPRYGPYNRTLGTGYVDNGKNIYDREYPFLQLPTHILLRDDYGGNTSYAPLYCADYEEPIDYGKAYETSNFTPIIKLPTSTKVYKNLNNVHSLFTPADDTIETEDLKYTFKAYGY